MKESNNHTEKDLFAQWEQESDNNKQQLNINEMETILKKASSDFSTSIRRTLLFDMGFKAFMIVGFIVLPILYPDSIFTLVTSLLFGLTGIIAIAIESNFVKNINRVNMMDKKTDNIIREQLDFYRSNMIKYPVILGITYIMFYVVGSMIYHALAHGEISPFDDAVDVIVLTGLMVIGFAFSIGANFPFFKSKIQNLESLRQDINNESKFYLREMELNLKATITKSLFIIAGILGTIALIYLIIQIY